MMNQEHVFKLKKRHKLPDGSTFLVEFEAITDLPLEAAK
jgi:hypothetical protein